MRMLDHDYGPRVHIFDDPWTASILGLLGRSSVVQPEVNRLVVQLSDALLAFAAANCLLTVEAGVETRMADQHGDAGVLWGSFVDPRQRAVVVGIARGGTLPAQRFYDGLHSVLDNENIRQDHVVASRLTNDTGAVVGVKLHGAKIGGSVKGSTVFIPDPMAATGSSIAAVLDQYMNHPGGPPAQVVLLHFIVTPEYLRRITDTFPMVDVVALRVDRGLSSPEVLACRPGERWNEERGLDDQSYIVPGAGGIGEVLNNAWV